MSKILDIVKEINNEIGNVITGPNCIDPKICDGNCCFIQIHVPRILAEELIAKKWAIREDFMRGDTFSFKICVNLQQCRCNFFDPTLNGCGIHNSGIKPPHCWLYPTGLDPDDYPETCKKAEGWSITNSEKSLYLLDLLEQYVALSKKEANFENSIDNILERLQKLKETDLPIMTPSHFAGIQDGWDQFIFWESEGYNLSLKQFCEKIECKNEYFQCPQLCSAVLIRVLSFFEKNLFNFIQIQGFHEAYSLLEVLQWHGKL